MKPVAIVYVTDMERSLSWYRSVLAGAELVSTSPYWTEFSVGGATVALHVADSVERGTQVGLALVAERPLEDITSDLGGVGVDAARPICDEPFGRSMVVEDPDGLQIQINEHLPPGS
jgi:catechol 2,3-dioxygenase-like lactoylglutathione lyase family enzyme